MTMAAVAAWQVRMLLRSGREGAQWSLDAAQASRLEQLWAGLPDAPSPPRPTAHLSYAGLLAMQGTTEYLVYADHVERRDEVTSVQRLDASRAIESLILSSAPPGAVPRPD